ncbi:hypothetical protein [Stenotrophomonas sp. SY1]|uniref:hypothetical protein n=1 Tax=Stenotrophomonas sp. SY1 TaxID=477235 RepID=UPI001E5E0C8D|nr:hypothetical protein [Stenotrophomonas sp. SY1]MCD9087766.1 hypothetical protein [Stenotrophomonas sp. SY1]
MQQPRQAQHLTNAARGVHAVRSLAMCFVLLLSLLASLAHAGPASLRHGLTHAGNSVPAEERGGERHLEEESPAKLRRVASLNAPRVAQPQPALDTRHLAHGVITAGPLMVDSPHKVRHTAPGLRQQRGQAPPLV